MRNQPGYSTAQRCNLICTSDARLADPFLREFIYCIHIGVLSSLQLVDNYTMTLSIKPLTPPPGTDIDFGAVVENADLENLSGAAKLKYQYGMMQG